jgi:hypothetical protein
MYSQFFSSFQRSLIHHTLLSMSQPLQLALYHPSLLATNLNMPNVQPSTILNYFEQIAAMEGLNRDINPEQYWNRRREHISTEVRMGFSRLFGRDVESLEGWQRLCVAVLGTTGKRGVKLEELNSIKVCKKVRLS